MYLISQVYAAQPREGTETCIRQCTSPRARCGLCSSTPRGDGNCAFPRTTTWRTRCMVYAAQPREGTETRRQKRRGEPTATAGLCTPTPRGDGKRPQPHASFPTLGARSNSLLRDSRAHDGTPPCPNPVVVSRVQHKSSFLMDLW